MAITIDSPTREGALVQLAVALARKADQLTGVTFNPTVDIIQETLSVTFTLPLRQEYINDSLPGAGRHWQAYSPAAFANDGSVREECLIAETPDTATLGYDIDGKDVLRALWMIAEDTNAAEAAANASATGGVSYTISSETRQASGAMSLPLTIDLAPGGQVDISAVDYLA